MATSRHYPLNGLDLSFHKYHHHRLDVTDVLACRLMDAWLFPIRDPNTPGKALPSAFERPLCPLRDVAWESACRPPPPETNGQNHDAFIRDLAVFILSQSTHCGGLPCPNGREFPYPASADTQLIAVLRRYVFETSHPELRPWLRWHPKGYLPSILGNHTARGCCPEHHYSLDTARPRNCTEEFFFARSTGRVWAGDSLYRLRRDHRRPAPLQDERILSQGTILQDASRPLGPHLWSPGPSGLPPPVLNVTSDAYARGGPYTSVKRQSVDPRESVKGLLPREPGSPGSAGCDRLMTRPYCAYSTTLRTRRGRSEPPSGAYMLTAVPDAYSCRNPGQFFLLDRHPLPEQLMLHRRTWQHVLIPLYVPCPRVSEVDHRTRRRSLSRRHVARMFHVPSREGGCLSEERERERLDRRLRKLKRRCGWCGSERHPDDKCPVSRRNRCKCRPWPIYHTAKECPIRCSRFCVDAETRWRKGHGWPAMMCKARCCMCGLRGHCGRDCEQKRCRCGGMHLGQDCGWKPGCAAKGCDRFLCPKHCQECGSAEKPFVGRRCGTCLENGVPVGEGAHERGESKRTRYRRRRKMRETEERGGTGSGKAEGV